MCQSIVRRTCLQGRRENGITNTAYGTWYVVNPLILMISICSRLLPSSSFYRRRDSGTERGQGSSPCYSANIWAQCHLSPCHRVLTLCTGQTCECRKSIGNKRFSFQIHGCQCLLWWGKEVHWICLWNLKIIFWGEGVRIILISYFISLP